ncbi:hypothetical protein MUGA111182_02725 [Mucilaginibacter galii]|uniref:Uncharacterized protein n=1 Tax=Mucilaginibacter galii TaxID=2005073 RepID=A0A917JA73_9SPHI|nr:hypothetical protein [Mucilaginibacter galii]GGI50306.1 hypothetical protein GCM10011425_15180 [Mucilaginibacter galii]
MMTITDWAAIETFGNQYAANPRSFIQAYNDKISLFGTNDAALISMFGNVINLYKADANSTDFKPIVLDSNNQPVTKPCP